MWWKCLEAKQAAFEEANRIKNQFRALDDDEIDFLDEVKARQRAEEERLRRETEEGVEAFRAAQRRKERDGDGEEGEEEAAAEEWGAGARKRRRVGKGAGILKRRTTTGEGEGREGKSKGEEGKKEGKDERTESGKKKVEKVEGETKESATTVPAAKPRMGLVSYDSDEDD